ncbi:uncharacterized protein J8A68_005319 [[Candida] subhashii]|uniref:Survival protein SurE-like phosphatase/nucleotidase domain-containing protein n=1 Tax=[Candida] subhashii TaxID=561895 RepID=A0A8J5Q3I2_9ASCO|nr:uncharacterized protein J8A68_005319 [[Candida] subhashii]KAG7661169.1 hypothetical protein J8A68_005319 [[Candida] subhashii]
MQFLSSVATLLLASTAFAKTILLTNDDGWASTNIRATYIQLKEDGHDVYLVAPVSQRSGFGGTFDLPETPTLETNGGFNYPAAGAPSWGHEVDDDHIWYFNGTPASCVAFGASYLLPTYFKNNNQIDLVVSGPNEGQNVSPGLFTISGTIGATYNAVYRDIPAVAFSGANTNNSFFKDDLDMSDKLEPSTIYAEKVVEFVNALFAGEGHNTRALPLGVGLNVNFPAVGYQNETCTNPSWVQTRLSGKDSVTLDVIYNASSNLFTFSERSGQGMLECQNGDCKLPSEAFVVTNECASTVSVYSIDYDANTKLTKEVQNSLSALYKKK